jgi:hypothetical protein
MFVAAIMQEAWLVREQQIEVLKAEVDAFGYDLVLECNGVLRHVQLKSSDIRGKTSRQTINRTLEDKQGSCVVWIVLNRTLDGQHLDFTYLYFGGDQPHDPMPSLGEVIGRNPLSKTPRPNTRVLTKNKFEPILTTAQLLNRMFGAPGVELEI